MGSPTLRPSKNFNAGNTPESLYNIGDDHTNDVPSVHQLWVSQKASCPGLADQRRVQIETERWGREQWARVGKTWDA